MPHRLLSLLKSPRAQTYKVYLFLAMTIGYGIFNFGNHYVTESLYFETGAHIIHVPSGVRMVIILVSGAFGAAAISIASFPYAYWTLFNENLPLSIIISITSSLIPLLTLHVVRRLVHWQNDFSDLTLPKLLLISLIYAITNATIQQLIYHSFDLAARPINAWLIMFTGDILGIVIVLYLLRLIGKALKARRHN